MWTYLFPGTISARTYLKQQDFDATSRLVYLAEPLASLASALGAVASNGLLAIHSHGASHRILLIQRPERFRTCGSSIPQELM